MPRRLSTLELVAPVRRPLTHLEVTESRCNCSGSEPSRSTDEDMRATSLLRVAWFGNGRRSLRSHTAISSGILRCRLMRRSRGAEAG